MSGITADHALLIRQLETITLLSGHDRAALAELPLRLKDVMENRDIVREGDRPTECCLVVSGLVCRYKLVAAGRRQILSFHFPGDLPDLQSLTLEVSDHSLAALTPSRVAFIPHDAVKAAMSASPGVRDALLRHAMIDGSIFREWIANVGRRTALERVAHAFCECFTRMRELGLVQHGTFKLPLTQSEIGDATGISNVHVNRTLQELRRMNLIKSVGNVHSILDWELLQDTGDFSPGYLHLRSGGVDPAPPEPIPQARSPALHR